MRGAPFGRYASFRRLGAKRSLCRNSNRVTSAATSLRVVAKSRKRWP